jgi:hypothetical protein
MDATGKVGELPQAGGCAARKWLLRLLIGGVLLVLVCVGIGIGALYVQFGPLRSSEAYRMGLEWVQKDPTVIEQLGEPIGTVNWFPGGVLETDRADLHFPIAGPKGQAHVGLQARRLQGTWGLALLEVTFADGRRHSIDTSDSDSASEAPKWTPGDGATTTMVTPR